MGTSLRWQGCSAGTRYMLSPCICLSRATWLASRLLMIVPTFSSKPKIKIYIQPCKEAASLKLKGVSTKMRPRWKALHHLVATQDFQISSILCTLVAHKGWKTVLSSIKLYLQGIYLSPPIKWSRTQSQNPRPMWFLRKIILIGSKQREIQQFKSIVSIRHLLTRSKYIVGTYKYRKIIRHL